MSKQAKADPTIDSLTGPLLEIVEERAVLRTLYQYGHSIDYGQEDQWLDCFTLGGVFDIRRRAADKPSKRHEGREALTLYIRAHTRAPEAWHKHLLVEPVVTIDGAQASVESYFVRVDADDNGAPALHAFGRYVDELVKEADGKWRFSLRIAEVDSMRTPSSLPS